MTTRTASAGLGLAVGALLALAQSTPGFAQDGAASAEGEPQYGGTLTYHYLSAEDEGDPDTASVGTGVQHTWPVIEQLLRPDIEKFGPRGSNEFGFQEDRPVDLKYLTGNLLESWEVFSDKLVFHVRPGIFWSGKSLNPGVMPEPRELVAEDIKYNIDRMMSPESTLHTGLLTWIDAVNVTDKYTVEIETNRFNPEWWWYLGTKWFTDVVPRETVEAGSNDWGNLIGTGPFVLSKVVQGTAIEYERNDNYWRSTTINGKDYKLPFVDRLVKVFIADEAAQIAALRTGAVDVKLWVKPSYWSFLDRSVPDLKHADQASWTDSWVAPMRTDTPPFDNKQVRQALVMATDREAIRNAVIPGGRPDSWPLMEGVPGYVPMDERPPEVQQLFEFDPEKAKQMLADAGYPNGFTATVSYMTGGFNREDQQRAEILASMWANVGVTLNLQPMEYTAWQAMVNARQHPEVVIDWSSSVFPFWTFESYFSTGGSNNYSMYSNPEFDELLAKASTTIDEAERTALLEQMYLILQEDVPVIDFGFPVFRSYWWPWVKNYYGENTGGTGGHGRTPFEMMWVDQALKTQMGR